MSESNVFTVVCQKLEAETSLDQLEARGTVRLALKRAGLNARTVTAEHMAVVLENVLPQELAIRGIDNGQRLCASWQSQIRTLDRYPVSDSPEAVFGRLGGSVGV